MKQQVIYCEEEKKFFSVPNFSEEEKQKHLEESRAQAKKGEFGIILDSPEVIKDFKNKIKSQYGIQC